MCMISFPKPNIFPESAVTRARHITQHFVESKASKFRTEFKAWEFASVNTWYKQSRQVKAPCLMSKHVSPFGICVVGDYKARSFDLVDNVVMKVLQYLNRFAAWSSAHVKNLVSVFRIQKSHRNHRDFFLSENSSILSFVNNKPMKLFEFWPLAELSPSHLVESKHGIFLGVP